MKNNTYTFFSSLLGREVTFIMLDTFLTGLSPSRNPCEGGTEIADEDTEAQRGKATCQWSHRMEGQRWGLNLSSLTPGVHVAS